MSSITDNLKEKLKMSFIDKILKDKKSPVIKPCEGEVYTYSSSDEEYAEFLKNLEIINSGEPVTMDNTMRFNVGADNRDGEYEQVDSVVADENSSAVVAEESAITTKTYMDATDDKLLTISASVERLTNIVENSDIRKERTLDKVIAELSSIQTELAKIKLSQERMKESISDLAKVSDSVFELKNAQQGMKTAMHSMENSVSGLKKKIVTCMTLLSVLSFLVVIMQILNLFS